MPTPIFNPYMPQMNETIEQRIKNLTNSYVDLIQQMQFLLTGHLDDKNVRVITTDKLIAGEAKIGTALIETLIVGSNVGQGTAPRSFTAQPTTPYSVGDVWTSGPTGDLKRCITARVSGAFNAADWELGTKYTDDSGVTTIVGNVVTTGYINALNVTAGSVAAENITGTYMTGKIVRTAATGTARVELGTDNALAGYNAANQLHGIYCRPTGLADVSVYSAGVEIFKIYDDATEVGLWSHGHEFIYTDGLISYPEGTWNFAYATVTNLGGYSPTSHNHSGVYADASHTHGTAYVRAGSQNVRIQYFSDRIEVNLDDGTWKVIYFDA